MQLPLGNLSDSGLLRIGGGNSELSARNCTFWRRLIIISIRTVETSEPLALRHRRRVTGEGNPSEDELYDESGQLWVSVSSGKPLVRLYQEARSASLDSRFGETIVTKTSEGLDQAERLSTQFGETAMTRPHEGVDQQEALGATRFGETIITETREGLDQGEALATIKSAAHL